MLSTKPSQSATRLGRPLNRPGPWETSTLFLTAMERLQLLQLGKGDGGSGADDTYRHTRQQRCVIWFRKESGRPSIYLPNNRLTMI